MANSEEKKRSLLAQIRTTTALTQEELAERSGISARQISKLESGAVARPRLTTLTAIASALGLSEQDTRHLIESYRYGGRTLTHIATVSDGHTPQSPHQLPLQPVVFAGREAEVEQTTTALRDGLDLGPILVTGLAGMGKTALALYVGSTLIQHFRDGQLYACLSLQAGQRRDPRELLGELLRALGVPPESVPDSADERSALWRDLASLRSLLVLLDDAHDEEQVRPILAGGSCRVVVTSRAPLGGIEQAMRIRLGPVTDDVAKTLLAKCAGTRYQLDDSAAVARLIGLCGGIPLALRLVAARLSLAPHVPLAVMADRFGCGMESLDGLTVGDRSVERGIADSCRILGASAQQALAHVASAGLTQFGDWHLAALAELSLWQAAQLADNCTASGLVEPDCGPGGWPRYRMHELVHRYLRGMGRPLDEAVFSRLAAYAIHLCAVASSSVIKRAVPHVLWPQRPVRLSESGVGPLVSDPGLWFEGEWEGLVMLTDQAASHGWPRLAGGLLAALRQPLTRTGRLDVLLALSDRCADAAAQDGLAQACARATLASALAELGYYSRAVSILRRALPELEAADPCTVAGAWLELGWLQDKLGHAVAAVRSYRRSLRVHKSIANTYGELGCHVALAELYSKTENGMSQARAHAQISLGMAETIGDYRTTAKVNLSVGHTFVRTGDLARAPGLIAEALRLARSNEDLPLVTSCLIDLSRHERQHGRMPRALDAAAEARDLGRLLGRQTDEAAALTELGLALERLGRATAARAALSDALLVRAGLGQQRECDQLRALLSATAGAGHL